MLLEELRQHAQRAPHRQRAYDNLVAALRDRAKSGVTRVTEDTDLWFTYAMEGQDTESWSERVFQEAMGMVADEGIDVIHNGDKTTFDWA